MTTLLFLFDRLQSAERIFNAPPPRADRTDDSVVLGVRFALALLLRLRLRRHRVGDRFHLVRFIEVGVHHERIVNRRVTFVRIELTQLARREAVEDAFDASARPLAGPSGGLRPGPLRSGASSAHLLAVDVGVEPFRNFPTTDFRLANRPRERNALTDSIRGKIGTHRPWAQYFLCVKSTFHSLLYDLGKIKFAKVLVTGNRHAAL